MKIDLLVLQKQMKETRKHVGIEDETETDASTTNDNDTKKKDTSNTATALIIDDSKKSKEEDVTIGGSNTILTKSLTKSLNDEKEKKKIDETA